MSSLQIQSPIYKATRERRSRPFLVNPEAQPLIAQLESAFTGLSGLLAVATPTPMATEVRDNEELQLDKEKGISHEALAFARAFERSLQGLPDEEREAKKAKMVEYAQQGGQFSHLKLHINTVYCACSFHAASGKGPSLESLAKILVGEGLPVRESHQRASWTITTANVTSWKSGQLMIDTIPHSDFWALQETHLPGSEQMATAQRWSRKRGWAAFLQCAEVVGEHYAANRGGVAMGGPQHISSSVPTEFRGDAQQSGCSCTPRPGPPIEKLAKLHSCKTFSCNAQARRHSGDGLS